MITRHHPRSGQLDKPENCHDQERASALNRMQAPPRASVALVLTSGSLLVLLRLATCKSGWLPHAKLIGARCGLVNREDVLALVEIGCVEEKRKGVEITDAGNDLVRDLVRFAASNTSRKEAA